MALGPMILLAGVTIKSEYFVWAGAMIASNGWLDVIIWSCTMVFLAPKDIKKAGLEDFRFLRTDSVKYGNIVWVEGGRVEERERSGSGCGLEETCLSLPSFSPNTKVWSDRWARKPQRTLNRSSSRRTDTGMLMDPEGGIQIETSTMVMVENQRQSLGPAFRSNRLGDTVSVPSRVAHFF